MWVTPLMAAALSDTKAGLPVKNGSISTADLPKSRRNAEWPYQVICMEILRSRGRRWWPSISPQSSSAKADDDTAASRASIVAMPVLPLVEAAALLPPRGALIGLDQRAARREQGGGL